MSSRIHDHLQLIEDSEYLRYEPTEEYFSARMAKASKAFGKDEKARCEVNGFIRLTRSPAVEALVRNARVEALAAH